MFGERRPVQQLRGDWTNLSFEMLTEMYSISVQLVEHVANSSRQLFVSKPWLVLGPASFPQWKLIGQVIQRLTGGHP